MNGLFWVNEVGAGCLSEFGGVMTCTRAPMLLMIMLYSNSTQFIHRGTFTFFANQRRLTLGISTSYSLG